MNTKAALRVLIETAFPLGLLAVWWKISETSSSPYFPPLRSIFEAFRRNWLFDGLLGDVSPSLLRLTTGYVIGSATAAVAGHILGRLPKTHLAVDPIIQFLRSIPPPAFLPIGMLTLGVGDAMKIAVIAFVCFWPVLISTIDGVAGVDAIQRDTAVVFGISQRDFVRRVVVPAAMPHIFAGLKVGLALSVILMVISEMVASTNGLGFFILQAQSNFAISDMWSGILMLGIVGGTLNWLLRLIERLSIRWYYEARELKG